MSRFPLLLAVLAFGGCRASLGPPPSRPAAVSGPHAPLAVRGHAAQAGPARAGGHEEHAHGSRRGTPFVHAFHTEPAFLARHLLLHAEREGDAHGVEAEVEWPLAERWILIAEVPFAWTEDADGLGDVALGVRALLHEGDRFLLSAQGALSFPTAEDGLGADEVVASPSLLAWTDLGAWVTAQAGLGLGYGSASGSVELTWGAVLAKSFRFRPIVGGRGSSDGGTFSVLLEGRGATVLRGDDEGASSWEVLAGVSVPLFPGADLRAGYTLVGEDGDEAASGWIAGLVLEL